MKDRKEENHSQSLLNANPFTQLQMTSLFALQEGKKSTIVENATVNGTSWIPMLLFIRNIKFDFLQNLPNLRADDSIKIISRKCCLKLTRCLFQRDNS